MSGDHVLGIDFGTSNSAAGICVNGAPFLIDVEPGEKTLPTSVFFDFGLQKTQFGSVANRALINGEDGRFMRSLKSVLGTPLMHEPRRMMGKTLTFVDIIAQFLAAVKQRAETQCHCTFSRALSGRPVHFHSNNAQRDVQALRDLRDCYERAGFLDVQFLNEPEAAAIANGGLRDGAKMGLIVDIGGGTSDFTLFSSDRSAVGGIKVIASHGVRVGGTNFDKNISVDHVMPLFGRGSLLRNEMGAGTLNAPNSIFQDLATWEKIPFLYTGETRRMVDKMHQLAVDPDLFARLQSVLELEVGHDMAFAVERGKIAANKANRDGSPIDLRMVEKGLGVDLSRDDLALSLAGHADEIKEAAFETLRFADVLPSHIDQVIFVGGSSLMEIVSSTMAQSFPNADLAYGNAFTGVVDGLALASAQC